MIAVTGTWFPKLTNNEAQGTTEISFTGFFIEPDLGAAQIQMLDTETSGADAARYITVWLPLTEQRIPIVAVRTYENPIVAGTTIQIEINWPPEIIVPVTVEVYINPGAPFLDTAYGRVCCGGVVAASVSPE